MCRPAPWIEKQDTTLCVRCLKMFHMLPGQSPEPLERSAVLLLTFTPFRKKESRGQAWTTVWGQSAPKSQRCSVFLSCPWRANSFCLVNTARNCTLRICNKNKACLLFKTMVEILLVKSYCRLWYFQSKFVLLHSWWIMYFELVTHTDPYVIRMV